MGDREVADCQGEKMEVGIFDVSHGFCAYLVADNGNVMLLIAGTMTKPGSVPHDISLRTDAVVWGT